MKTPIAVLDDLCKAVKAEFVGVTVYKQQRPTGSVAEDCVVRVVSGTVAKHLSTSQLTVMLFTNAITASNTVQLDTAKALAKESALLTLSGNLASRMQGYTVLLDSRDIYTAPVEGANQFYTILKINIKH